MPCPWLLLLRVTERCNAQCVYCVHETMTPHPDMPLSLYKQCIDDSADYIKTIHPIGYGEPLLWPHIVEGVRYARERRKRLVLYTNASLLTENMSRRLLDAGLNEVRFSIEADTKEVFEFLRYPLKFDIVMGNVRRFIQIKNEGGYKCGTKYVSCTSPENRDDVQRIISFFKNNLGIDKGWFRREVKKPRPHFLAEPYLPSCPPRKLVCKHVNQYISVTWNGDIIPCCQDVHGTYVLGNFQDGSLLETFNGASFEALRHSLVTGENVPVLCANYCFRPVSREKWNLKNY